MTSAAFIREQATAEHRSAARELATFLALFDKASGQRLVEAWSRDLRAGEAVAVAAVAFAAVEPEDRVKVMALIERLLPDPPAGFPEVPLMLEPADLMADAALWAVAAYAEERRAYAMAALAHMSEEERHGIVRALDGREAA